MVKIVKGGIKILIHIFFISFIINLFISFYAIYSAIEILIFHNLQGYKLKIKSNSTKF